MEKLHFTARYPAENFDLHNISDPFDDVSRSKSEEHSGRFSASENLRKITKNKEN